MPTLWLSWGRKLARGTCSRVLRFMKPSAAFLQSAKEECPQLLFTNGQPCCVLQLLAELLDMV